MRNVRGYVLAAIVVGGATLAGVALAQRASLADEAMLYALAILIAAHAGRGPGLVAAGLSIITFDFFFVEPRYTLDVADPRFLITFAVMFAAGVAIGSLGSRARERAALMTEKLRLVEAAREAEIRAKAEEVRNALLSAVSHDLRTPLAVITGTATTLRERAPDGEHEDLDTIVNEAARLGRILENLLAVTKVEAGAKPRREWVPIEELVGAALARLESSLADRAVGIAIEDGVLGHLDPILGELLFANLLDNASKHTPPGTPIELAAGREGTAVVFEVADRGPGLPPGTEQRVFERFYRGAPDGSGVGLGLAVCRGIAAAHAGTIEALPRDGGGTVFRVRVPDAAPVPELDIISDSLALAPAPGARARASEDPATREAG